MLPSEFWPPKIIMVIAGLGFGIFEIIQGNILRGVSEIIFILLLIFYFSEFKAFADSHLNRFVISLLLILAIVFFGFVIIRGFVLDVA